MALTQVASGLIASVSGASLTGTQTIPKGTLPTGCVLQVVRNSEASNVTSTTSTLVNAVSASITPSSASSKILVIGMSYCAVKRNTTPMYFYITLRRSSTVIGNSTSPGLSYSGFEVDNTTKWVSWQDSVIDEPASTSSLSYNIAFAHTDAQYGGYSPNQITVANSVLILMEISA
jgi:hypothetical protein